VRLVLVFVLAFGVATLVAASSAPAAGVGFTRHAVSGLPVSVALPTSWQHVDVPASLSSAILKRLVAIDPLASSLASPYLAHAGIRFMGNEAPRNGLTANVNLIVKPLPHNLSLRAWFFGGSSAVMQNGTTTRISNHGTPGLHYQTTKQVKYGTLPLLTDAYAFAYHGRAYDFTYTCLATKARTYSPIFSASGRSIRFTSP
jgi:hypothetical protein